MFESWNSNFSVGFQDIPYAEDYYLGAYSECNWDTSNPTGVCPDYVYAGGTDDTANSTKLIHGQQLDGTCLITKPGAVCESWVSI